MAGDVAVHFSFLAVGGRSQGVAVHCRGGWLRCYRCWSLELGAAWLACENTTALLLLLIHVSRLRMSAAGAGPVGSMSRSGFCPIGTNHPLLTFTVAQIDSAACQDVLAEACSSGPARRCSCTACRAARMACSFRGSDWMPPLLEEESAKAGGGGGGGGGGVGMSRSSCPLQPRHWPCRAALPLPSSTGRGDTRTGSGRACGGGATGP